MPLHEFEGAIGIISGGDLWLTNSRYSNDDEELNCGHRLVDSVLDELQKEAAADASRLNWLRKLRVRIRAARGDQVYVCCFCERDNLLSQWRGYAENGGGVSLEFDPHGFTTVTGPDSAHGLMRLWKVFYDRGQQQKIIRDCVEYHTGPSRARTTAFDLSLTRSNSSCRRSKTAIFKRNRSADLSLRRIRRLCRSPNFERDAACSYLTSVYESCRIRLGWAQASSSRSPVYWSARAFIEH